MLRIVAANSDDELELYRIRETDDYFRCPRKRCHHRWKDKIGNVIDRGTCPKCGNKV